MTDMVPKRYTWRPDYPQSIFILIFSQNVATTLFTTKMKVYSNTKVSDFINRIAREQSLEFQDE